MTHSTLSGPESGWRQRLWVIIFESHTPAGWLFDVTLIVLIVSSVIAVMLESVAQIRSDYGWQLHAFEWLLTGLFTLEYLLRIICVRRPLRYVTSFYGVVDLVAILPSYLSLIFPGAEALMVIRFLRVLRIFRVLKLAAYLRESRVLMEAIWASRRKMGVFLLGVMTLLTIIAAVMYLIEGEENGFTDIPTSLYWAIVTLTTVGFGDIAPKTNLGRAAASVVMILGYGIIAVPTGIVTVELSQLRRLPHQLSNILCLNCGHEEHDDDAKFCKLCGTKLQIEEPAKPPNEVDLRVV